MNQMTPEPEDEDLPPYFHDPAAEPAPERPEEHLEPEEAD